MNFNIINEYITFSKSCINKYLKKILGKYYNQNIANRFLNIYINSRYYDIYLSSGKDLAFNIRENLINASNTMKKQEDPIEVDNTLQAFEFIYYFDNVIECESTKEKINEIEEFRKERLNINKNSKYNSELLNTIKEDLIKKKDYVDTIENKKFELSYELTNISNLYEVTLNQNLKFPIVYNSAVIDKIFNSSDISQRKAAVEYSFTALKVLKDVIKGNFNYRYLVKYPSGISKKKTLNNKLYSMIENEMLKERIIIKIQYSDFQNEKEAIYERMRKGYKYAIVLDDTFKDDVDSVKLLSVFKYILVKKDYIFKGLSKTKNVVFI